MANEIDENQPTWSEKRNNFRNIPWLPLILFFGFFGLAKSSFAGGDIFISQTAQGNNSGANCANAHSAAWFNTASNWNGGAGTVQPGDTIHLCGTFTFAANDDTNGLLKP